MPPMIDIRLDLPEPDGPTTLTLLPASTTRSTPRRIATGPAALGRVRCTSGKLDHRQQPGSAVRRSATAAAGDGPAAAGRRKAWALLAGLLLVAAAGAGLGLPARRCSAIR